MGILAIVSQSLQNSLRNSLPDEGAFESAGANALYFIHDPDSSGAKDHVKVDVAIEHTTTFPGLHTDSLGLPLFYLSLKGKLDFDTDQYSAPVVPNEMNPGFGVRLREQERDVYVGLGYFHLSNGQFVDATNSLTFTAAFGPAVTEHISRGWDYFTLNGRWYREGSYRDGTIRLTLDPEYRLYTGRQFFGKYQAEEDDWWNSSPQHPKLADYDGLRLKAVLYSKSDNRSLVIPWWSVSYRISAGNKFFSDPGTLSQEITVGTQLWILPLFGYYSAGFVNKLSEYQIYEHSIGAGLSIVAF
jgi:hypothetical protein